MKKTASIFLVLILLISYKSYGQTVNGTKFISLEILTDSLQFDSKEDTTKVITLKFSNRSNASLLTYGLSSNHVMRYVPFNSSNLCKLDDVSSGLGQILCNSEGVELLPTVTIKHRANRKPMTRHRLDSTLTHGRGSFLKDTVVFKKFSSRTFEKRIDLHDYEIEKGTYYIQVIFYCGKQIGFFDKKNTEEKIARDSKSLNAKLYQGCTLSNKIKIIVN